MNITTSVTKSSGEDHGPCYLQLAIFFSYTLSSSAGKQKLAVIAVFISKLDYRSLQLYILQDHLSVRIGFNMINKCYRLPTVYTILV